MSFIVILVVIFIELSNKSLEDWRRFDWFTQLTDWVIVKTQNVNWRQGPVTLIAVLAPVVLSVWIASAVLNGIWVVFGFLFSVFILLMAIGPHDPMRVTQEYIHALQQNDPDKANQYAEVMLNNTVDNNHVVTAQYIKETLFIKLVTHILGVFFWFLILGPVGAVLFRANCILRGRFQNSDGVLVSAIDDLHQILFWIPARLTVLGFALVGSFIHVLDSMQHISDFWKKDSEKLLIECGLGALYQSDVSEDTQPDLESVQSALALAKRTVVAWLTLLGILVLTGWLA